jgi:hypothetical protein
MADGGGGGGGGTAGDARPNALRAAVSARDGELFMGGSGALIEGGGGGGLETEVGGNGGAAGGAGDADEGGGGGGRLPEGLREDGGGMGGFLPIGGGFGLEGTAGEELLVCGVGRILFLRADTAGLGGGAKGAADGGIGGAELTGRGGAPGGLGAADIGRDGAAWEPEYDESSSAPVLTPPDLRSLGIPPANRPPS